MSHKESDGYTKNPTFAEIRDIFVKSASKLDKSTIQRATFWLDRMGDKPIDSVTPSLIRRTLNDMPVASPTRNRYASALSVLYRMAAVELDYDGINPAKAIVKWAESEPRTRHLTRQEISALLDACRKSNFKKLRALVLLAVTTGMRRGSLTSFTHGDIDVARSTITISRTKNGTAYTAVVLPDVMAELAPWHRPQDPNAIFFAGRTGKPACIDAAFNAALKRAGLGADVCFHTLRHTAASMAAQSGASTIQIMDLLNHKTPTMAARYSHMNIKARAGLVGSVFGDIR